MSLHSSPTGPSSTASACPDCGGRLNQSDQETHCTDCGLVVDEQRIDYEPEWRSFDADERARTVTRHNKIVA